MAASGETKGRRRSFGMSLTDMYGRRIKKPQYENTYRLEPKMLFPVGKATAVIKDVVDARLSGMHYDADKCMALCKSLANDIKEHIKDLYVSSPFFSVTGRSGMDL